MDEANDWKRQRRSGIAAIAASIAVALAIWLAVRFWAPPVPGMESLAERMVFALKCCAFATLFCLAIGVEAVAHERLQSPAFDPLVGHETRRLRVNQRYLQNTLEQILVFAVGLFGLAAYSPDGEAMRAVEATTLVWVLARFAFWIGYHRSAAMRGIGAPGMMLSLLVLLYVVARAAFDLAGTAGAAGVIGAFTAIEAVLFWTTRAR
ncbi:MAG TPA: MAPEG family protein [Allosphingosinicella sp.]|nr:MAPEG family protein [Allosphingosinicella sp.]